MKKRKRTPREPARAKRQDRSQRVDQLAVPDGVPQAVSARSGEAAAQALSVKAEQPPSHAALLKKIELGLAIALTLFAIWLHVMRMAHAGGLWRDEAAAAAVALSPSVRELAANFQYEAFPLLFPLIVRASAAFLGSSDMDFRIFGLLVGLSLLAALWLNTRLSGHEAPLLSLACSAAKPWSSSRAPVHCIRRFWVIGGGTPAVASCGIEGRDCARPST